MSVRMFCAQAATVCWLAVCAVLAAAAEPAPHVPLGKVEEFSFVDTAGEKHSLDEWRGSKAVVLWFLGSECPVSNGYSPRFRELAKRFAAEHVLCYGVHCDPTLTAADAAQHAKQFSLEFPILLDPEQRLARAAGARVTPDSVVLAPDGTVLYRGRVDDRYALNGKRRDVPTTHELQDALEAVVAGKVPEVREARAFGCPLSKLKAAPR